MSKVYYEEGPYVGEVVSQALGESATKGTPFFMLKVKILGIPSGDDGFDPVKTSYERSIYFYLTEKTAPFVVENLSMIGFAGKKISQLDPDAPNAHIFKGQQVDLYCSHEEYEGEWKERWNLSRVLEVVKMEPKKLRQIEALFGKALKSSTPSAVKRVRPEDEDQTKNIHGVAASDSDLPEDMADYDNDPTETEDDSIPF